MNNTLDILLYNKKVGTLTLLPGDSNLFIFDEAYIQSSNRPTLSLSFLGQDKNTLQQARPTQTKLPPFFSNLLPEGPLRTYLATQANVNPEREFYLLQALGDDLPGAITVQVAESSYHLSDTKLTQQPEQSDNILHFSLAGMQMKFSALLTAQGGLTIPAHGVGGEWIVKLPSPRFPHVPENEYAMLQLAQAVGINIPPLQLIDMKDIAHLPDVGLWSEKKALAIKRFDRGINGRIHIEDFAQVYGLYPHHKYTKVSYNNIAKMLFHNVGVSTLQEFIRRLTYNTLIGNADMHLKNWSFIYYDKVTPQLAPGYDYVSTIPYLPAPVWALTLGNTKSMYDYDQSLLMKLAEKADIPRHLVIDTAIETAALTQEYWSKLKNHLPLNKETVTIINQHMQKIPLLRKT